MRAAHYLVRRAQVGGELRLHDMATLTAELRRVHMLERTIADLRTDEQVHHGHDPEEDSDSAPGVAAVRQSAEMVLQAALRKRNADGNEDEAEKKHGRNDQEDEDADIRIVH